MSVVIADQLHADQGLMRRMPEESVSEETVLPVQTSCSPRSRTSVGCESCAFLKTGTVCKAL